MADAAGTILVVDDEETVREFVVLILELEGYNALGAANAEEAFDLVDAHSPDLVLLDVMMPGPSGHEVLARIRETSMTPVIFLTARSTEADRIAGLELGADDYIAKPFSPGELAARVRAVLRRTGHAASPPVLNLDGLVIDQAAREVMVNDKIVELPTKEFDLLVFLANAPGRAYTREEILQGVWHSSEEWQQSGTVTEHVRRLRLKIEDDPENPRWVQTVRGVGYRFERRRKVRATANQLPDQRAAS